MKLHTFMYNVSLNFCMTFTDIIRGVWMIFHFFDCSSPICFLLIEFHCAFSISYKMLTNCVYYYCIWLGCDRPSGLPFFHARFISFHTHTSLLTVFCFFILFHSCCSHAWMFGKTLVREFPMSYSHTEWYIIFSDSATTCAEETFETR